MTSSVVKKANIAGDDVCSPENLAYNKEPGMCEHRFCSQTKTIGDRNCTACFSLANIF